jgi:feruloyl-CoA synthase
MSAQPNLSVAAGNGNASMPAGKVHPLRAISFGDPAVTVDRRDDGTIYLRPKVALADYPVRLTDRLHHWAALEPDRIFMAERDGSGWRQITYAQLLASSRRIASALLARNLSADRPVVILSGNSIDHALVAFGALYAGIPFCPVSPAYSLISRDYGKLGFLIKLLTPGLVFADDATKFADALRGNIPEATEIVAAHGAVPGRDVTLLGDLLATPEHPRLDAAHDAIGPDTIAKFLLTSGSTGNPKAVINTQRMICANQVMLRETLAFLKDEPPVIVDWLPWNHTFGGNHNIGLTLFNGGSMYLDEGKPMPGGIEETVRNLREVSPTVYFNVPKGYESLLPYLRDDAALRAKFFHRLHAMFFSGAALSPYIWNSLDELAVRETGFRVPVLTGLGATETAPFFMSVRPATSRSGHVGLPVSGNDAKLIPNNGKLEVRASGPNVTPGYWRQPELTAAAFDEEGFYKFGDAIKPVDPDDFSAGFDLDGRIAEDFKLASGTWVSVGPLRARFVAACAPMVRDVVIAGINRDEVSALVILDLDGCRLVNPALPPDDLAAAASDPVIRAAFRERLEKFLATSTGSSTRITRAVLIDTALSIDRGEVTDKGSINQRAVLDHRNRLIDALYAPTPAADVITLSQSRQ